MSIIQPILGNRDGFIKLNSLVLPHMLLEKYWADWKMMSSSTIEKRNVPFFHKVN